MSAALTVAIADEVVTLLNAASAAGVFGANTFTAVRRYAPLFKREDLGTLTVSVVPKPPTLKSIARNRIEGEHEIDIAFQKALQSAEDPTEIDPLTQILDQVVQYVMGDDASKNSRRILPQTQAKLLAAPEYKALADPKILKEQQCFTGVLTLTYIFAGTFR